MSDFNDSFSAWHNRNRIQPETCLPLARELRRVYNQVWPHYHDTLNADEIADIETGYRQAWPDHGDIAFPLYTAQVVVARVYEILGAWEDGSDLEDGDMQLFCIFFGVAPDEATMPRIRLAQWRRNLKLEGAELSIPPEDPALLEAWLELPTDESTAQ